MSEPAKSYLIDEICFSVYGGAKWKHRLFARNALQCPDCGCEFVTIVRDELLWCNSCHILFREKGAAA